MSYIIISPEAAPAVCFTHLYFLVIWQYFIYSYSHFIITMNLYLNMTV